MFDFFKRKKEIKISQSVWKNKSAKYKGLFKEIAAKENVWLLYYFNDTKAEIDHILAQIPPEKHSIRIESATKLLSTFTDLSKAYICFAEHHPSFQKEDSVLQHLLDDCQVQQVYFHIALDEPLMLTFGGDNILQVMEKMGFKEEEAITGNMVLKSVQRAQKKLDASAGATTMLETFSSGDWIQMNVG